MLGYHGRNLSTKGLEEEVGVGVPYDNPRHPLRTSLIGRLMQFQCSTAFFVVFDEVSGVPINAALPIHEDAV